MAPAVESLQIAVLTYRRADDIRDLLPMLMTQAEDARSETMSVGIVVVDNDPDASARDHVADVAAVSQEILVRYEHEPVPGISAGRNRALDACVDDDLLVFIDDDERPSPRWLASLLAARETYGADVVQGPVSSEFDIEPDEWVRAGEFFKRRRMPTGTALDVAVTNNLLMDLRVVRRLGLRFDLSLGTTGGEDTLLTKQLYRAGVSMVWCAEAGVIDRVPADRSTRRWVRQRALSMGNASALVSVRLAHNPIDRVRAHASLALDGLLRVAAGSARVGLGRLTRSRTHHARGTRTLLRGLGMAFGAVGYRYHEYGRPDGSPSHQRSPACQRKVLP